MRAVKKSALVSFVSLSALFAHYTYEGFSGGDSSLHELEEKHTQARRRDIAPHSADL